MKTQVAIERRAQRLVALLAEAEQIRIELVQLLEAMNFEAPRRSRAGRRSTSGDAQLPPGYIGPNGEYWNGTGRRPGWIRDVLRGGGHLHATAALTSSPPEQEQQSDANQIELPFAVPTIAAAKAKLMPQLEAA